MRLVLERVSGWKQQKPTRKRTRNRTRDTAVIRRRRGVRAPQRQSPRRRAAAVAWRSRRDHATRNHPSTFDERRRPPPRGAARASWHRARSPRRSRKRGHGAPPPPLARRPQSRPSPRANGAQQTAISVPIAAAFFVWFKIKKTPPPHTTRGCKIRDRTPPRAVRPAHRGLVFGDDDDELLVRASAVLKSQGKKVVPWETR